MERIILIKAGMKRHRGSLAGILLLVFLVSATLSTVFTLWSGGKNYLQKEIDRAGFGTMTVWVSKVPDLESLQSSIASLETVERIESQSLIYAEYEANGQESDSEGQLIFYEPKETRYRFFRDELTNYQNAPLEIPVGQVYVSPSLVSMMHVKIGDEITFSIARNGGKRSFTVAGYYEDPFMGSSMIGMKGFLISKADWDSISEMIQEGKMDSLGKNGAMLHIFSKEGSSVAVTELNSTLNRDTQLPVYTEFIHSKNAILGFMLILQNAFGGLFLAFALVLFFIALVILGHSISAVIEQDYVNFGILKTVGITAGELMKIQLLQYLTGILLGMAGGIAVSIPLSSMVSQAMVTTTGIMTPHRLPPWLLLFFFGGMMIFMTGVMAVKLRKLSLVTPMRAIRGETLHIMGSAGTPVSGRNLMGSLALRQLLTGKRRYISVGIVAILLVFSAVLVGRMNSWLRPDGEGMMSAFNPADHDIGIQASGTLSPKEAEELLLSYTDITDSYLLAMPNVSVNGVNYTANVITEPDRFHIFQGKTCTKEDEIVLTESAAKDLSVSIGDSVTLRGDKGISEYRVSGIYQCANDMGKNVGMSREGYLRIGQDTEQMWCYHYFLSNPSVKEAVTEALEKTYGGDVHVHENSWPGLFGIISAMHGLLFFLYGIIALFILIVTIMSGSRLLRTEQKDMGIYKSLGFSTLQLRVTFALRFAMTAALGAVVGIILGGVITDPLVSSVMKLAGIGNFASNQTFLEVLFPGMVVVLLFTGTAFLSSGKIRKVAPAVLAGE